MFLTHHHSAAPDGDTSDTCVFEETGGCTGLASVTGGTDTGDGARAGRRGGSRGGSGRLAPSSWSEAGSGGGARELQQAPGIIQCKDCVFVGVCVRVCVRVCVC